MLGQPIRGASFQLARSALWASWKLAPRRQPDRGRADRYRLLPLLALLATFTPARAGDWPGWRGPTGQGHTSERDLPLTWGGKDQTNVRWKVALLPGQERARLDNNQSSPIISGGRIFVTASFWPAGVSEKQYPEHHVLCFRLRDGRRLWDTRVRPGPWLLKDLRGGYTAPTPAADGKHVFVVFGSSVIAALDFQGRLIWRKEIRPFNFDVAIGASPILYRDTVLFICDQVNRTSRLQAYDARTGDLQWERPRPEAGFSHSTPVLVSIQGKTQLLVAASGAVQGVDPANGKVRWWCQASGDTLSPVYGGGLVYCDSGRGGGPGVAVDPTGQGDVTKTYLKWKVDRVPEGFSSPVIGGDYLYRLLNPGVLRAWMLATGKPVYAHRLEGVATAASPFATPEGHIYCASAGRSYVILVGPTPKVLGINNLDDPSQASPAVADGCIILKGRRFLFCVSKK
jgi:outer membrane protein assembly factor BamB